MKKIYLTFSFFLLISPVHAQVSLSPLHDVAQHVYQQSIFDLYGRQIVYGNEDGSYRPDAFINRAEFTTILARTVVQTQKVVFAESEFDVSCFADVPPAAWYTPSVCFSKNNNIVQGRPDGLFWPGDNTNFAEAAKIIVKTLNVPVPQAPEEGFKQWYEEFIYALSQKNAIPPSITRADQRVTRAEMAEIVSRLLNGITDRPSTPFENFKPADPLTCIDKDVPSSIDMARVREAWLKWTNDARAAAGLHAYQYHDALHYSGRVWSEYNAAIGSGSMTHLRPGDTGYYNYSSIKNWFSSLGISFGGSGTQFTENITWGPFSCSAADCTDQVLKWTKSSFDHFLAERAPNDAHRRSILNGYFDFIGLGLAVDDSGSRYYVTIHYAKEITGQPGSFCE